MIVLDTNVISALMRPSPAPRVVQWFAAQPGLSLWTTAMSRAEILYGVWLLPEGRRRTALMAAVDAMFKEDFRGRVLPFTSDAAVSWARIVVDRAAVGRPISHVDAQIAAIARRVGASVATRHVPDFEGCGIDLINPWSA